jgi:hypothetical protein
MKISKSNQIPTYTNIEEILFPRKGTEINFTGSILWFRSTSGPLIDSYQEIWHRARNSGPFSLVFGRHGNEIYCRLAGKENGENGHGK